MHFLVGALTRRHRYPCAIALRRFLDKLTATLLEAEYIGLSHDWMSNKMLVLNRSQS